MTYTFYRRRELNKMLQSAYPDLPWQEKAQSMPRMRTHRLPENAKRAIDTYGLSDAAYSLYQSEHRPLPVFILIPAICRGDREEYDVNYLDITRDDSAEYVRRLAGQGRVFF